MLCAARRRSKLCQFTIYRARDGGRHEWHEWHGSRTSCKAVGLSVALVSGGVVGKARNLLHRGKKKIVPFYVVSCSIEARLRHNKDRSNRRECTLLLGYIHLVMSQSRKLTDTATKQAKGEKRLSGQDKNEATSVLCSSTTVDAASFHDQACIVCQRIIGLRIGKLGNEEKLGPGHAGPARHRRCRRQARSSPMLERVPVEEVPPEGGGSGKKNL